MKQIALAIILFWTFSLIFKILSGFDSSVMKVDEILVSPNFTDWFGKDDFGRDIYFRLIDGFINSFEIIFYVTLITSILGIFIGVLSGYLGGRLDQIIKFITTLFMSFPGILLAIAFAAILTPGKFNLIIALSIGGWVGYARLARAQTLLIKEQDFVRASQSMGSSKLRTIFRHILPALSTPMIVEATYAVAGLIIAEASLSFLGLGLQAPEASWGGMMRDSVRYLLASPHYAIIVGASIMSMVFAINFIGDFLHKFWGIKNG
ncbi:MAG: ABC transporter permease [Nitrosomonadales bacterium]|jgi:peptide/nickel transport system permease protein|nr:ABC transporter permease [Nitrosomonadales bacterium]MBT3918650.1 ABC transporter permease [Nitrosomonadales bacterium]MBT4182510.1 ABC transporter permease [Nitrosomonadales bacterium]MBT4570718.1 ABC transporter permease [Nitrosomonadales bacterium]MBT5150214.1 ABC transporter permease [Nitrosomonadales bacterium]